jgi:hypothetical protein
VTLAYYTTPISENIEETPEGFLICRDVVIARTGWQTYKIAEIPQEAAAQLGVDVSNPHADIELYRGASDVFSSDTMASAEGKPLVDDHPPDFVEPNTFQQYARGHMQNVRRRDEPLEDGNLGLIADLHITAEPLISKVRNRVKREVSLGYDYGLRRDGDRICMVDQIINHGAVVTKGRAGSEARINDSAPIEVASEVAPEQPQPITVVKERKPVKNRLLHMLGLGFKEFAKDAEPEELAAAAQEMAAHKPPAEDTHPAEDKRKRMHDALDRMLDGGAEPEMGSEMAVDRRVGDADMDELKCMLDEYFSEEAEEPQHAADEEEDGGEGPGEETEPDGEEEVVANDRGRAADRAAVTADVLRMLRPVVARSKDSAVKNAFNTVAASVNKVSRASSTGGGYGKFAATARSRDAAPAKGARAAANDAATTVVDPMKKLQAAYDAALKGGK